MDYYVNLINENKNYNLIFNMGGAKGMKSNSSRVGTKSMGKKTKKRDSKKAMIRALPDKPKP